LCLHDHTHVITIMQISCYKKVGPGDEATCLERGHNLHLLVTRLSVLVNTYVSFLSLFGSYNAQDLQVASNYLPASRSLFYVNG
jgi:hypothetical protein